MMHLEPKPPIDRLEFWIRFFCAFIIGSIACAYVIFRYWDTDLIILRLAVWLVGTVGISIYAARVGDYFWQELSELFGNTRNR